MADEEGFVRRWSRRKSAARTAEREPARETEAEADAAPAPAAQGSAPPAAVPERRDPEPSIDLDSLPDIESLTYESDFTVFLRAGVPAELRKRALQRLWRSDPVLANLDGLLEYGEDYTKIGTTKQLVRTAYQVGRGMLERLEPGPARATPEPAGGAAEIQPASGRNELPETEPPALEADAGRRTTASGAPAATAAAGDPADAAVPQPPRQGSGRARGRASARPAPPRPLPKRR